MRDKPTSPDGPPTPASPIDGDDAPSRDDAAPQRPDDVHRRDVLRGIGSVAVGATLAACDIPDDEDSTDDEESTDEEVGVATGQLGGTDLPEVLGVSKLVGGFEAYAETSVRAGENVHFRVSTTVPYELDILRLGWVTPPAEAERNAKHATFVVPNATGLQRGIRTGSYVWVKRALTASPPITALTLECWVRPFYPAEPVLPSNPTPDEQAAYQAAHDEWASYIHWQGLITQYTYPDKCGFGLFLTHQLQVACYFGNGGTFNAAYLKYGPTLSPSPRKWRHIAATFSNGVVRIIVDGVSTAAFSGPPTTVTPGTAPLRLAAYGNGGATTNYLDGDLAMPVIYASALTEDQAGDRYRECFPVGQNPPKAPTIPSGLNVEACWPLDEEQGKDVRDAIGMRPGKIVNRATWQIGGPSFNALGVSRYAGNTYSPSTDPLRGHALRFSENDIYDNGWDISHTYTVPSHFPSGMYVGRFRLNGGGVYDVPFVVRPAFGAAKAPIAVLSATNTWYAYNSQITSLYGSHRAGQPTYAVGLRRPIPGADATYGVDDMTVRSSGYYGHLLRAERPMHSWLEQNGYDYDLYSDRDLHNGALVTGEYRIIILVGHSEYWSEPMYNRLKAFLGIGGQVICASGNTMFWRVSIDDDVIECRKILPAGAGVGEHTNAIGEAYHTMDQLRGGLMREAGVPAWKVIGLDTIGFGQNFVPCKVTAPSHDFFTTPETTGVGVGTELGNYAVGHEYDATVTSIPKTGSPGDPTAGDLVGYDPIILAEGRGRAFTSPPPEIPSPVPNNRRFSYDTVWSDALGSVLNEMIDWTPPGGGRVFSTGSIATAATLLTEPAVAAPFTNNPYPIAKTFRNAIHHMGVQSWFTTAIVSTDGHLRSRMFTGLGFDTWFDHGGGFRATPPAVIMIAPNRHAIFALDTNGYLLCTETSYSGSTVSHGSLVNLGNSFVGRPAVVRCGRKQIVVFVRGIDNHLYERRYDGISWEPSWNDLGDAASDPAVTIQDGTRIGLAVRGSDGHIKYRYRFATDLTWFNWQPFPLPSGVAAQAPTIHAWRGNWVSIFAVRTDGQVFAKHWDGAAWQAWVPHGGDIGSRIAVASWGARELTLFATTRTGSPRRIQTQFYTPAGWSGWGDFDLDSSGEPSATTYRGGSICVTVVGSGGVIGRRWDGTNWTSWQSYYTSANVSAGMCTWLRRT